VAEGARRARDHRVLALYRLALATPACAWLSFGLAHPPDGLSPMLLQWVLLLAALELVATERWGGPGLSAGFAVQVALAMLYDPVVAGGLAFLGTFDLRELRGSIAALHAMWRRCLALVVTAAGSETFHAMASGPGDRPGRVVLAFAATIAPMYLVLLAAEAGDRALASGVPLRELLYRMDRVSPYRFPMTFPGLGWLSLPAAKLYLNEGLWPVLIMLGLAAYARMVCLKSWNLKEQLEERNVMLAARSRELAVHLDREQRTVSELEELNRLKSQFVAIASHEVRTPLTAIIGYANTLRRLPARVETDKRNEFLDIIERQARRLLGLVERLLTASRLENGRFVTTLSTVNLAEVCREVVEGIGLQGQRVRVELPPELPELVTDRRYLSQVIGNLVENALKYSPRERPCSVGARRDGERLAIWVLDHGAGIPLPEQRRIFDRFYQVDRSDTRQAGGVGLGLTLVRELVDVLGGTITVESGVGRGSRFTVIVPLRHPAAHGAGPRNGAGTSIETSSNWPDSNGPAGTIQSMTVEQPSSRRQWSSTL
jgi:signal transduction histidine kinase